MTRSCSARQAAPLRDVDAACVVVSTNGIVYSNCEWAGNTVNGSIARSGDTVDIDLLFKRSDEDSSTDIETMASLTINDAELNGFLDIDMRTDFDGSGFTATFDSDFDVVLADGCPTGGSLEVHAVARAAGQTQSAWVLAEFGPSCGDVVVR